MCLAGDPAAGADPGLQSGAHVCATSSSVLIRKWKAHDVVDMTSSELSGRHKAQQTPGEAYKPCIHTYTEQIWREPLAAQVTDRSDSSSLVLQWGESAAVEELLIDTTELCRHNLIYIHCIDLHWLIMVQEEVHRVLSAHHWDKTIISCFVSLVATSGKRKHHLHMTVDCKTDTLLLNFYICPFFFL